MLAKLSGLRPFCYHPSRVVRDSGKHPLSCMLGPFPISACARLRSLFYKDATSKTHAREARGCGAPLVGFSGGRAIVAGAGSPWIRSFLQPSGGVGTEGELFR